MAKYDTRADLAEKVRRAKYELNLAEIRLKAFDWLVDHEVGSITAAGLCEWSDSIKVSKEFTDSEKDEYRKIWDNA